MNRDRIAPVISFWLIACAISWPFMFLMTRAPEVWQAIPIPVFLKTSLYMWGPGIAALICYAVFRKRIRRTTTLTGKSKLVSLTVLLVPVVLLGCVILINSDLASLVFFAALLIPIGIFNLLGEELGWRGFLQDAFSESSSITSFVLVGLLWELWHLPVRTHLWQTNPLIALALGCGSVIISILAGMLVRRTCAVFVGVSVHQIANMLVGQEIGRMFGITQDVLLAVSTVSLCMITLLIYRGRNKPVARQTE